MIELKISQTSKQYTNFLFEFLCKYLLNIFKIIMLKYIGFEQLYYSPSNKLTSFDVKIYTTWIIRFEIKNNEYLKFLLLYQDLVISPLLSYAHLSKISLPDSSYS